MAKKKFEAQNRIEGLATKPLETGDVVELDEKDAADFVSGGSLKPAGGKAKEPSA